MLTSLLPKLSARLERRRVGLGKRFPTPCDPTNGWSGHGCVIDRPGRPQKGSSSPSKQGNVSAMSDTGGAPVSLLGGFKSFFLWIGGTLAGITALLYTSGYLVTRSHLAMLGLYGLVEYGNDHFLQEGAKFVITSAYMVLRPLLSIVAVLGVAVLATGAIGWLVRQRSRGALARQVSELLSALARSEALRRAAFAVTLLALLWHVWHFYDDFERPLGVADLLYADPSHPASEIDTLIVSGDTAALHGRFEGLLWGTLLAGLLMFLAWRVAAPWRSRGWLVLPFAVTLALYVVTLPMAYGVLERPVRYALVSLLGETGGLGSGEAIYLLDRGSDGFVVWDGVTRRVLWLPASGVRRAEVRGVQSLFRPERGERP